MARLHSFGAAEAEAAGVEVHSPEHVHQTWRDDVAQVSEAFNVAP
ncbi:hypothetical protein [Kocuria sp.]|nr:hypothetical protein [Kocuria sp.]MDO5367099.1 hypothetical protein [Kocuria sp.]